MSVSKLVAGAFGLARQKHQELRSIWIRVSFKIGERFPDSSLSMSVQRDGDLDLVLWCMEDDGTTSAAAADGDLSLHYQKMLSELWVGSM